METYPLLGYALEIALHEMLDIAVYPADEHGVYVDYKLVPVWEDMRAKLIRTYREAE